MKIYYQGETFRQKAKVQDISDGSNMDPHRIRVTIVDSAGIPQIEAQGMTKEETGQYYYDYTLADDAALGEWVTEVEANIDISIAIEHDLFRVLKRL